MPHLSHFLASLSFIDIIANRSFLELNIEFLPDFLDDLRT